MNKAAKKTLNEIIEIYMTAYFQALASAEAEHREDAYLIAQSSAAQIVIIMNQLSKQNGNTEPTTETTS